MINPTSQRQEFIPAKPSAWVKRLVQEAIRAELVLFKDKLHLHPEDVDNLSQLPTDCGVILASNHADEADVRVVIELSRRSRKQFITMCNREAFDELKGFAGWVLQSLGYFSVKRGAKDLQAKEYAMDVVRAGKDILVVFPEGEIFYQNEKVQHFHPGVADICLKSICENRNTNPNFTAFVVPMVIKYHYSRPIENELDKRISAMEKLLSIPASTETLQNRLLGLAAKVIEMKAALHDLPNSYEVTSAEVEVAKTEDVILEASENFQQDLSQKIRLTQNAIFQKVERRHDQASSARLPIISRSWKLGAELRKKAAEELKDAISKENIQRDLADLQEVEHLSAWSPRYLRGATSNDRLAESVMKLERELYKVKRPKPIPGRDILVSVSKPLNLGEFASDYEQDAKAATTHVTQVLQTLIQAMLDDITQQISSKHSTTVG